MNKLSKIVQINIILSLAFIIIAMSYPYIENKVFYAAKIKEAESICELIDKGETNIYARTSRYKEIDNNESILTSSSFNIDKIDIKYYDYFVTTQINSFKIEAFPKKKYLLSRAIKPQVYIYEKILNSPPKKKWR